MIETCKPHQLYNCSICGTLLGQDPEANLETLIHELKRVKEYLLAVEKEMTRKDTEIEWLNNKIQELLRK